MTVKEQHIEINQATQKLGAAKSRKLQPEEIDWLLNKNQERFIQGKIKPRKDGSGGFEIDQLGTDALRTILVTKVLTAEYSISEGETLYRAILPGDYSYLISDDSSRAIVDCNHTFTLSPGKRRLLILPFRTSKITPHYFLTASVTIGPIVLTLFGIQTAAQGTYSGLASSEMSYIIRDLFLWHLRRAGLEVFWEYYGDKFYPKSFVIISPGAATEASISIDGMATTATIDNYNFQNYLAVGRWKPNRLSPTADISTVQQSPFSKSGYRSAISELEGTSLWVYGEDSSFIVTRVRVSYVKKPRRIDLSLGQDCELPPEFHQAVCDLTVEYYKNLIEDPNWEAKLKDNIERSTTINP